MTAGLVASLVLLGITGLGFLPISHGFIRACDFPRQQVAVAAGLVGIQQLAFSAPGPARTAALVASGVSFAVQMGWILRFTPVWPQQARSVPKEGRGSVRLLTLNVKMSNRDYARTLALIRDEDPQLILLHEIDEPWAARLEALSDRYPHRVVRPQDNGYGLALLSRFPLEEVEVREVLVEAVPSVRAVVVHPDGLRFRLYGVHPEPPVPTHDTIGRDAELAWIGEEVAKDDLPCVVAGDLNDVGWSQTSRLFQRLSGLVDPRIGRGFFNTFDARFPLLRWPLDHVFHDGSFGVVSLRRLPSVGSDHFPMFVELRWTGEEPSRAPAEPSERDREVAQERIAIEKGRDRRPIGEDWEGESEDVQPA